MRGYAADFDPKTGLSGHPISLSIGTPIVAALVLTVLASTASAQSKRFYDSSGKSVGTSATDSQRLDDELRLQR